MGEQQKKKDRSTTKHERTDGVESLHKVPQHLQGLGHAGVVGLHEEDVQVVRAAGAVRV